MSDDTIAKRWNELVEHVADVAKSCGRDPKDVLIIGVTKYADLDRTRELYDAGCRDFGESRPQSMWEKADGLSACPLRWHLIGHLQRNKSRRTVSMVHCIHSVDSLRLAEQLERDAGEVGKSVSILLEVNISGDTNKTGMLPSELQRIASRVAEMPHLRLLGLMGMAGLGAREPRADFAAIRELRDRLQTSLGSAAQLDQLSMGMSGDYIAAIEEGATMIRLGSILLPHTE